MAIGQERDAVQHPVVSLRRRHRPLSYLAHVLWPDNDLAAVMGDASQGVCLVEQ